MDAEGGPMTSLIFSICSMACTPSTESRDPQPVEPKSEQVGIHEGVQHPPIPADSPAWRHDPGGFVPDVRFYGERDWDGVRMRVAGHIAVIERDRARLHAQKGQYEIAANVYASLAETLQTMIPAGRDRKPRFREWRNWRRNEMLP